MRRSAHARRTSLPRSVVLALCLWAWMACVAPASAIAAGKDHVVARAYYMDGDGRLTAAQVAALPMQPAADVLAKGYTRAALWLRLTLQQGAQPLTLYVLPAYSDNVQLHWRDDAGQWRMQQSGDRFPYSRRSRPEANIAFDVQPARDGPREVYLRVQSRNSLQVWVRAYPRAQAARFTSLSALGTGLYLGIIGVLLAFGAARYRATRDPAWLVHMALLGVSALIAMGQLGLLAQLVLPDDRVWVDRITNAAVHLQLLGVSAFFWMTMRKYDAPTIAWIHYPLTFLVAPWVLWNVFAGDPGTAMATNSLLILGQSLWSVVPLVAVRIPERMESLTMRALLLAIVLAAVYFILPLLGVVKSSIASLYPAMITNLVIVLLQSVALNRRGEMAARALRRSEERERALARSLAWEKAKHAESASFLGMLIHELKTPLASIRLAAMSLAAGRVGSEEERARRFDNIQRYVGTIDGVLERVLHADRLEQGAVKADRGEYDVVAILDEVMAGTGQRARIALSGVTRLVVHTDADLLRLMLRNLLDNALAYSPPDASVQVEVGSLPLAASALDGRGFGIRVSNPPGKSGLPDPGRVFTKYYRAEHAHNTTGSGLGLYWVSGVARILGGTLHYLPTDDCVVFQLDLPD